MSNDELRYAADQVASEYEHAEGRFSALAASASVKKHTIASVVANRQADLFRARAQAVREFADVICDGTCDGYA